MSDVEPYVPQSQRGLIHYTKVYQLGDPRISDLLHGRVEISEKVDGSQFRFGRKDGKMLYGSHRMDYSDERPVDNLFLAGVHYIDSVSVSCPEGLVFFSEYLAKSKHNTIQYGRIPKNGLMLFGVLNNGIETWKDEASGYYLPAGEWASSELIGYFSATLLIDPPNILYEGDGQGLNMEKLTKLLATPSYLGVLATDAELDAPVIEGIVIKNYALPTPDPFHPLTMMAGKLVRKSFKEENDANWRSSADIMTQIKLRFKNEARFEKALVHAREEGQVEGSMRDMVPLLKQLDNDVDEEIKEIALAMLWYRFEREIRQGIKGGLAEWYKTKLAKQQFEV